MSMSRNPVKATIGEISSWRRNAAQAKAKADLAGPRLLMLFQPSFRDRQRRPPVPRRRVQKSFVMLAKQAPPPKTSYGARGLGLLTRVQYQRWSARIFRTAR